MKRSQLNQLKAELLLRDMKQVDLANKLGIKQQTLSKYLNGTCKIGLEQAKNIKEALGLSNERAAQIFFGD